jgi:hypothetical protein
MGRPRPDTVSGDNAEFAAWLNPLRALSSSSSPPNPLHVLRCSLSWEEAQGCIVAAGCAGCEQAGCRVAARSWRCCPSLAGQGITSLLGPSAWWLDPIRVPPVHGFAFFAVCVRCAGYCLPTFDQIPIFLLTPLTTFKAVDNCGGWFVR